MNNKYISAGWRTSVKGHHVLPFEPTQSEVSTTEDCSHGAPDKLSIIFIKWISTGACIFGFSFGHGFGDCHNDLLHVKIYNYTTGHKPDSSVYPIPMEFYFQHLGCIHSTLKAHYFPHKNSMNYSLLRVLSIIALWWEITDAVIIWGK